ncbi:excinuclease ABC subunit UvrC [Desulfospira joergensenii]|uniref:excinuclease ABC subunit UvrC n=1 Tax=Desulfospira joergensenii TaxID=53329 RepID=UPI0003B7A2E8|nr:excinuclease ABC subunit UvrC [Desulfospira joergensenii]
MSQVEEKTRKTGEKTREHLMEKYRQAPSGPGVYLMKNGKNKIIYVGKAKNLKKRLSSYFIKNRNHDPKTAVLISMIKDFDLVITASDHEAFILESNLIKEHRPKYNVILKDGKNYPLLRVDMKEEYPSIQRVRRIQEDAAVYFGPYSSSRSVNQTLKQIQKIFKLRRCRDSQFRNRSRPCLNYQIKACLGLCTMTVSPGVYKRRVRDAILFLRGKSGRVLKKLEAEMKAHAKVHEFEKAAQVRDTIFAIKNVMEKQAVVCPDMQDRDIFALASDRGRAVVTVMMVRSGRLIDTAHYPAHLGFKEEDEILSAFLDQYYEKSGFIPSDILVSREMENQTILEQNLKERRGKTLVIHVPARGEKKRLMDMALRNASRELEKLLKREEEEQASMVMLQTLLGMEKPPERIECFDNSNISGQDPVSSMAVFTHGRPDKGAYRKYIIKDIPFQDDYAYMFQVLERRFSGSGKTMTWPDLLVVDGGKGQLNMALAVLRDLGIENEFALAGLAKKNAAKGETEDKIYIPGRSNPLNIGQAKKGLFLLEQVRDEAHRFAISFQRKRREKRGSLSVLDTIPGIGPMRRKSLLTRFKGIEKMKKAGLEEIAALPGMNKKSAQILITHLNSQ